MYAKWIDNTFDMSFNLIFVKIKPKTRGFWSFATQLIAWQFALAAKSGWKIPDERTEIVQSELKAARGSFINHMDIWGGGG